MSVSNVDSIDKIIDYFAVITKVPFTHKVITVTPKPLIVKPSLAKWSTCPSLCGACCQRFSLDYIDGEDRPEGLKERPVEFNGKSVPVWTDYQTENKVDRCKHLSSKDGRCGIHGAHPFTCDFELIRVYMATTTPCNRIGVGKFGRSWQLTRFDSEKGAVCEIKEPNPDSVADNVRKLKRLETWAAYFGLTEHWIPELIAYLKSGRWSSGKIILGGTEEDCKQSTGHEGRTLLEQLIAAGIYRRPQIMEKLLEAHPEVPKQIFATWLTDVKKTKSNPIKRQAIVTVDGIYKFQ